MKNPQMYKEIEQLRQNNGNPMELLKQITNKYTPEQMEQLYTNAKRFGVPDEVINQVQNAYLLSELKPCPSAAYIVPNPNCCYNYGIVGPGYGASGCGCTGTTII